MTVTNLSAFGDSVYSQYAVTANKTLSTVLAAAPARTLVGYHLDGWLVNGKNAAKLDGDLAVTAFAKNGTVLIKPVYSANAGTYTFDAPYTHTSDANRLPVLGAAGRRQHLSCGQLLCHL